MKPEFDKPLAEMTLAEIKDWCYGYRKKHAGADACEETGCPLYERGICCNAWVHDWYLTEKPKFTNEEISCMKLFQEHCSNDLWFERRMNGCLYWVSEGDCEDLLPYKLFPSIKKGERVRLSDVINANQN